MRRRDLLVGLLATGGASALRALGNRRIGARMNHLANADLNCDCSPHRLIARSLRSGGLAATEAEVMMMLDESSSSHLVSDTRSEIQGERSPSPSPAIAGFAD
jgi:hypothetical protein